jgi:hypothetical protein
MANIHNSAVREPSAAVQELTVYWEIVRALMQGTDAMRAANTAYLPKWPNEDQDSYNFRLATATLFPAYSRTIKTLVGKPFAKPITWNKAPSAQVMEWTKDIDLQGRNLDIFSAELAEEVVGYGIAGILVDAPNAKELIGSDRTPSQAEEMALGIRPYFVCIHPWQLLGWHSERVGGVETLTMLRLFEIVCEKDGEFGEKKVEQVRVLEPGKWRTFRLRQREDGDREWYQHANGVTTLKYIPFFPAYGNRLGFMLGKPPMMELAYMNIKHWQSQSDQDTILHVARVPILAIAGIDDPDGKFTLNLGTKAAVKLPHGGEMKYVEHTGAAISSGKISLDDLKEEMRQAGAELLVLKPGSITATQINTEQGIGLCDLQRIAMGLEDTIDKALACMAEWGQAGVSGSTNVHKDFAALTLAEASATLLHAMRQSGDLSSETLFHELQRRGIIAPDIDHEAEKARIATDGPPLGAMNNDDGAK